MYINVYKLLTLPIFVKAKHGNVSNNSVQLKIIWVNEDTEAQFINITSLLELLTQIEFFNSYFNDSLILEANKGYCEVLCVSLSVA